MALDNSDDPFVVSLDNQHVIFLPGCYPESLTLLANSVHIHENSFRVEIADNRLKEQRIWFFRYRMKPFWEGRSVLIAPSDPMRIVKGERVQWSARTEHAWVQQISHRPWKIWHITINSVRVRVNQQILDARGREEM